VTALLEGFHTRLHDYLGAASASRAFFEFPPGQSCTIIVSAFDH
jgi:hypothetical protein